MSISATSAAPPSAGPPPRTGPPSGSLFKVLRHRDFALFWSGSLLSNVGMWMQNIAVPLVLYQRTEQAAWIGLGAFLQFLPALLVGGVGGMCADRFPRRRILLCTQGASMLVAAALWLMVDGPGTNPAVIAGLVALSGLASGFGIPAWQSFVPQLVPREDMLAAMALNSLQHNASRAFGFVLGGIVVAEWGPRLTFGVNALSYLAVLGALLLIGPGRQATGPAPAGRPSFRPGVDHARSRPGVMAAIATVGVVAFLGSPVIQLAPVFARHELGVGVEASGLLAAALGAGALAASGLLGRLRGRYSLAQLVPAAVAGYGLAVVGMALTPNLAGGMAAMFVIGVGYLLVVSLLGTSIQLGVEDAFRGRVMALYGMAFTAGFPLGSLIQGALADVVGVRAVVGVSGLLLAAHGARLGRHSAGWQ